MKKGSTEGEPLRRGGAPQKGRSLFARGLGVSPGYNLSPLRWKAPSWPGRGSGGWSKELFRTILEVENW